jgi:hypothetical protein
LKKIRLLPRAAASARAGSESVIFRLKASVRVVREESLPGLTIIVAIVKSSL